MAVNIRKPLRKFLPHLLKARDENLNEADTLLRVLKVFEEILGYDPLTEISREQQVREKYVDLALKVDGVVRFLVEAKAAGTSLRDRHIEQAEGYAAKANIPWVILTNGVVWNLYHLTFDEGIEAERAFCADLSAPDAFDQAADSLALLHRHAVRNGEHEAFWKHRAALSPESVARAVFTEEALRFIRREIRRRDGLLVDEEDLANAIREMFSQDVRERIGAVRIRRRRPAKRPKDRVTTAGGAEPATAPPAEATAPKRDAP